jgi:four helix bundle protein
MNYEMKAESKDDRDLRQRTKAFAIQVIRMFSTLPKSTEAQVLGKQVLRSGTSVGANYREAYRSRSKAEFIAKLGDCLKELDEKQLLVRTTGGN